MAMHVVQSNEDMASDFIVGTCQLIPKSFSPSSDHMHDLLTSSWDPLPKQYMILCGSQAEFYIRPLNTCIADVDSLVCRNNDLAFSGDIPVLPSDLSGLADKINCYEIQSYPDIPGFVRLIFFGKLQYNWKHKRYNLKRNFSKGAIGLKLDVAGCLTSYKMDQRIRFSNPRMLVNCGPAVKWPVPSDSDSLFETEIDTAHCLFCPQWPSDAKYWPLRLRNNGWPTSDAISEVVRNGCHVVYVQHRACRDDTFQWRLSFSVA